MVLEIALGSFTDPKQIGWAKIKEGDALVWVKIIRGKNGWPQVAIPSEYRGGTRMRILEYTDTALWEAKQKAILEAFALAVPPDIYYPDPHEGCPDSSERGPSGSLSRK
jgi:hypothetical protein